MAGESVRPEVVEAIVAAITMMNPAALEGTVSITRAERDAANSVAAALLVASQPSRDEFIEIIGILVDGGYRMPMTWGQAWVIQSDENRDAVSEIFNGNPPQLAAMIYAWREKRGYS